MDVQAAFSKNPDLQKTRRLLRGPLLGLLRIRLITGLSAMLLLGLPAAPAFMLLISEFAGRLLFFRAVDAPKMPGGIAS
jgi:hypothetical protein